MRFHHSVLLRVLVGLVFWVLAAGCGSEKNDVHVLKIGVLAPLSGVSGQWGKTTIECAQATADYWNERGGFVIDEQPYRIKFCLLYTSPSPRDGATSRMPSSA